jgi:predicted amidophosphoribosyltransferase
MENNNKGFGRCRNCGLGAVLSDNGLCPACEAWIVKEEPPKCRECGKVATKSELLEWEDRHGGRRFGAGRYKCKGCRPQKNKPVNNSLPNKLGDYFPKPE